MGGGGADVRLPVPCGGAFRRGPVRTIERTGCRFADTMLTHAILNGTAGPGGIGRSGSTSGVLDELKFAAERLGTDGAGWSIGPSDGWDADEE